MREPKRHGFGKKTCSIAPVVTEVGNHPSGFHGVRYYPVVLQIHGYHLTGGSKCLLRIGSVTGLPIQA